MNPRLALTGVLVAAGAALGAQSATAATVDVDRRTLEVVGTPAGERIALRVERRFVQIGSVRVRRSAFDRVRVAGRGGRDVLRGAALGVPVTLDGGAGDDTLIGGRGAERLLGRGGRDRADGNRGRDVAVLGADADRFTWNPGDGNDVVDGRAGGDALVFNGSRSNEVLDLAANGRRLRLSRDVGSVAMDLRGIETVTANPFGGADTLTVGNLAGTSARDVDANLSGAPGGVAGDMQGDRVIVNGTDGADGALVAGASGALDVTGLTATVGITRADPAGDVLAVNGLDGEDTLDARQLAAGTVSLELDGGPLRDMLLGSEGADTVDGGTGDDVAHLGDGNDSFRWDPGEGSDVLEGEFGHDELLFNGSGAAESFDVTATGQRVRLFRDVGAVTMDFDGVERLVTNAQAGTDAYTISDMFGTALVDAEVDLGAGDGARDRLVVNGSVAPDDIDVTDGAVSGLAAPVRLLGAEATDSLTVNALGGDDRVDASALSAGVLELVLDAGDGHDDVFGGRGRDLLLGGDGVDRLDGNQGDDTAFMGSDGDMFRWDPGDGSDVVEGQTGRDELVFNGSGADEVFDVAPNGQRIRFQRDVGAIVMDVDGVEQLTTNVLGGADAFTVGDLTGTVVSDVDTDLAGVAGGSAGDGQDDRVTVTGTDGVDMIQVSGTNGGVQVAGLAAHVGLTDADPSDALIVDTRPGPDRVGTGNLLPNSIALTIL